MQLHFTTFIIHHSERFQQVSDAIFNQQGTSQYAHHLNDWSSQFEVVFDDTNDTVGDDCNVYLYTDSILRFSPKGFDSEMLFNPFKQFM